jgi:HPt (histidine-containing phosphotransfer) domain-containing protein
MEKIMVPGILNTEAALKRVGGNEGLYIKILETFLKKHVQAHTQIVNYLQQGSIGQAKSVSHSLKGVAQIVGSNDLHTIITQIDGCLSTENHSELPGLLKSFRKILTAAITRIEMYLAQKKENTIPVIQHTTMSRKEILRNVDYLADLLEVRDMKATRVCVECIQNLPDMVSTTQIITLQESLDSLDFNKAAFSLQSIKQQIVEAD